MTGTLAYYTSQGGLPVTLKIFLEVHSRSENFCSFLLLGEVWVPVCPIYSCLTTISQRADRGPGWEAKFLRSPPSHLCTPFVFMNIVSKSVFKSLELAEYRRPQRM